MLEFVPLREGKVDECIGGLFLTLSRPVLPPLSILFLFAVRHTGNFECRLECWLGRGTIRIDLGRISKFHRKLSSHSQG